MILFARPTDAELQRLLDDASSRDLTYAEIGCTREPELPTGYRHHRSSVVIGNGNAAFGRGKDAIRSWQAHRHAGATLMPPAPALEEGAELVGVVKLGLAFVTTPCRIVYVTDDEDAFGFGYGTLPGHPEAGEEAFHVIRGPGGEIRFEIVSFSRPADLLARLGGPVATLTQKWVTGRYLEGVRRYVALR